MKIILALLIASLSTFALAKGYSSGGHVSVGRSFSSHSYGGGGGYHSYSAPRVAAPSVPHFSHSAAPSASYSNNSSFPWYWFFLMNHNDHSHGSGIGESPKLTRGAIWTLIIGALLLGGLFLYAVMS